MNRYVILIAYFLVNLLCIVANIFDEFDAIKRAMVFPCTYDVDCVANAFCDRERASNNKGHCDCKTNYIPQLNKTHMQCLKAAADYGEDCEKDIQCQVPFGTLGDCKNNKCACQSNSHFEVTEKRCYKSASIGESCTVSNDCYVENAQTYCVRGVCECHGTYHPIENGSKCVPNIKLGQPCSSHDECTISHSRCNGVCRCLVNYVVSQDEQRCLKAADNFGEGCEEDSQCSAFLHNGVCIKGVCGCSSGSHIYERRCWSSVAIDDACEHDNQCKTSNVLADLVKCDVANRTCVCIYGKEPTSDGRSCRKSSDDGSNNSAVIVESSFCSLIVTLSFLILIKYDTNY